VVLKQGVEIVGPYASLADAKTAGAVTVNYGLFFNNILSFLIVAFAMFMVVKAMNSMKKKEEAKPAAPPKPSAQEVLLGEIRDLLAKSECNEAHRRAL
jgi:large conductance mechanosensitive channel